MPHPISLPSAPTSSSRLGVLSSKPDVPSSRLGVSSSVRVALRWRSLSLGHSYQRFDIELTADSVILDDFTARREASRLGLTVKGTLAIIKKLKSENKIDIESLDELYQKLLAINFRVKHSLFDPIFADETNF